MQTFQNHTCYTFNLCFGNMIWLNRYFLKRLPQLFKKMM